MDIRRQYERVFKHLDGDNDGRISAPELQRWFLSLSKEECEAAVKLMDSDGDGAVSLEEFVKMMMAEGGGEEEEAKQLREAFKMYEMEKGCGYIHPKSLQRMLTRLGDSNCTISDCRKMISRFDLNGDGVLSFDEFRLMMSSSS